MPEPALQRTDTQSNAISSLLSVPHEIISSGVGKFATNPSQHDAFAVLDFDLTTAHERVLVKTYRQDRTQEDSRTIARSVLDWSD